jgi:molybdate transport system substrate-binding protein
VKRLVAIVALCLVAAGCGSSSKSSSSPTTPTTTASGSSALTGPLTVFAAASLKEAFTDLQTSLKTTNPGLSLTYNFAGSQMLVQQIEQGAPADVVATADQTSMQTLVDKNLVGTPQVFAKNLLEIAVAPGNPKHITSLADLEKPDVTLVLADPSVPAGKYALKAFENAGLPAPKPKSQELDVKSTLAKLTSGEADAVVVYQTDVKSAGSAVEGVPIPDNENVLATYPIAVVKASTHQAAAQAFVDQVVGAAGQGALKARGFLASS